jgi:hypothetical protein
VVAPGAPATIQRQDDAQPGPEHLLVRAQAERAAAIAEPLPELSELPAAELLATPLADLLADQKHRAVVARHLPEIATTELLTRSTPSAPT